jgi:pimeloyl-ACP methyl ester carboxylesterase
MMSQADFDTLVRAFRKTGLRGADSWYLNDAANKAYASEAPGAGYLLLPVLFVNGALDPICDITRGSLGRPMRTHCVKLREVSLAGGHWLMLECAAEVNASIQSWLADHSLS